ncbi:hypothetical protein [Hyalangium gracile]|uniref:hypothetical protein n=1 Tax=Hyalangium gracile TaxID=394092 RepID=UPI001CCC5754|nr:hypothetical protein [Hyalangium gracile]
MLKRRFDGAAFLADWKAKVQQDKRDLKQHARAIFWLNGPFALLYALPLSAGLRLMGVFEALVSGARQVEATELEGTEGELRQQLLAGRIQGTDLVLVDGGWQSFADTALFEDTCDEAQRRNRWWTWLSWSLSMLLGIALIVALIWGLFALPGWLMSVD